jgi:hypothetical protein
MRNSHSRSVRTAFLFLVLLAGTLWVHTVQADWPQNNTNVAKWWQFPDPSTNGFDVFSGPQPGNPTAPGQPVILADDFLCTRSGPISDVHIWASWLGLTAATNLPPIPITLGIWTDVPALTNGGVVLPSHPGQLLWSQAFGPGQYAVRPYMSSPNGEQFWNPDPAPQGVVLGRDFIIWQYNFYPTNPFVQQQGTVYWLSVAADVGGQPNPPWFGWKTTATNHWGDDAVFGHLDASGNALGDWQELVDPRTLGTAAPRSLDFAFVLTTPEIITNPPPPPPPPIKWIQYPNLFGGYDIDATVPYVVADDFLCTNVSTITNIQIWSSFYENLQDTNLTFVLGIWSDSLGSAAGGFSHPANLLWTEAFRPGTYTYGAAGTGQEQFYVPATGQLTPESLVYLYSFTPQNPFCQQGSPRTPVVYWLSVYAVSPSAGNVTPFGWKTSTNHFRDDAVWGLVSGLGNPNNWHELFAPVSPVQESLDLAFLLNNGPPSPDCDQAIRPKWRQDPDTSTNGLDVLATAPEIVGDDFLCHTPGPISGITFWGSWLNDLRDTNATFVLRLWTDVPAAPGSSFSHPGQMLCESTFYSPNTVGTSLQRYNVSLAAANLQESFFKPDLGAAGFLGHDTQIWRYDFFPFEPGCWLQRGSPFGPGLTYWVTIDYLPAAGTTSSYLFGAKTARTQLLDNAVFGHLDTTNNPLGDWLELIDPRTQQSLDLSHALWNFPVHGINKDLFNNTQTTATGVQIVVAGHHTITWHYDGTPPWPLFQVSYIGGNTVLEWSGMTLPAGGTTHVGFEMAASSNPQILSMNWLSGSTLLQPPVQQGNFHWLNNGSVVVVVNNLAQLPLIFTGGHVEWFAAPVALDQMTAGGARQPLERAPLQFPPDPVLPGDAAFLPVPPAPPGATYALYIISLTATPGTPGTTDYLLVPLDSALHPQIGSASLSGNLLNLTWPAVPGRTYRLQSAADLSRPEWINWGDFPADTGEINALVPLGGNQGFYRVSLLPQ